MQETITENVFAGFEAWVFLWKALLIIMLVVFGTMAVWVSIGGFFDVRKLIRMLKEAKNQEEIDTK